MVKVCVDAMGGDERPEVVLEGIALALEADDDLEVLVAGDEAVVVPFCADHARATALVTTEVIEMGDHPAEAVRAKRDSSIVRACEAVRHGEADGFFSAGSTGAILAAATLNVGRVRGIKRPAIASALPGVGSHETVMLDLGANADCRPEMLVQFAQMGSAYSKVVIGVENPRVALLSNGTEDAKGSEASLAAFAALKEAEGISFVGNCEGSDILLGDVDVVVADGFTGNVALKSIEGAAKFIVSRIKDAVAKSPRAALGGLLLKPAMAGLSDELSGEQYGGAMLLGLKAPVLIGHGATSPKAVMNGTLATGRAVRNELVSRISEARS